MHISATLENDFCVKVGVIALSEVGETCGCEMRDALQTYQERAREQRFEGAERTDDIPAPPLKDP